MSSLGAILGCAMVVAAVGCVVAAVKDVAFPPWRRQRVCDGTVATMGENRMGYSAFADATYVDQVSRSVGVSIGVETEPGTDADPIVLAQARRVLFSPEYWHYRSTHHDELTCEVEIYVDGERSELTFDEFEARYAPRVRGALRAVAAT